MLVLNKTNSIANHYLAELRDVDAQKDSMRFRRNMERLGEIFAYEISKKLNFEEFEIQTPLGLANINLLVQMPVLATILRAGLPLHQGILNVFDQSNSAFISAYRKNKKSGEFIIKVEYMATPDLEGKTLIISDPMLATGQSMVLCCKELMANYKIKSLHIVSVIASQVGIAHVKAHLPNAHLWIGAIDEELTTKAYIVPGLGDAGDLAFGSKI
jgi:uracil phosphoribosyltransferase